MKKAQLLHNVIIFTRTYLNNQISLFTLIYVILLKHDDLNYVQNKTLSHHSLPKAVNYWRYVGQNDFYS